MRDFEYIKNRYQVPAEIGREVLLKDRKGVIAEDMGNYVGVLFDDCKPGHISPCHPTWEMTYLETYGKIRKMSKSQQRYAEFRRADWFNGSFSEWLGIKKKAVV